MVGVAPPNGDSGGFLRGVIERPADLPGVETRRAGCRRRCAKGAGDAVGRKAALVAEGGATHRHHHARADVVAKRYCPKQHRAIDPIGLACRERRRDDRAAGMGTGFVVRVVGLVGMGHHAVGKRGIDRRSGQRRAHHGDRPAGAAMLADVALRGLAGRQFGARNHRGQTIEQMTLGLLDNILRQHTGSRLAHIGAERAHDAAWTGF